MIGALIGGGALIAGTLIKGQSDRQAASRQMDFQQYNSDTAYQRSVKDMRAAGINPMMASQLGGASTPTGAAETYDNMGSAVGSAIAAERTRAEIAQIESTTKTQESQTALNEALKKKVAEETQLTSHTAGIAAANEFKAKAELPRVKQELAVDSSKAGEWMNYLTTLGRRFGGLISSPFAEPASSVKGLLKAR